MLHLDIYVFLGTFIAGLILGYIYGTMEDM